MSLVIDDLSVWLPGRGRVLSGVGACPDGVVLVTGRSGAGASTLLRAVGGLLPAGARVAGTVTLDGAQIQGRPVEELTGLVDATHLRALPADALVRDVLAGTDAVSVEKLGLVERFRLDPGRELRGLSRDARAALRLVRALGRRAPVVLLDQPLVDLRPGHRRAAIDAIRAVAADGTTVLWADHLLEHVLPAADSVLEIVAPDRLELSSAHGWSPRTVPAPPMMALARAWQLPRGGWLDAAALVGRVDGVLARDSGARHRSGDVVATAGPQVVRLDVDVTLRSGECVGVVSVDGDRARELDVARRLVAVARGEQALASPVVLPEATPVGRIVLAWERRHGLEPGAVSEIVGPLATLGPGRPPRQHSAGEGVALTWAMATATHEPRLLVDPTRGLDPSGRRHVARTLHDEPLATTVLLSCDVEVLTRACHRLLVIDSTGVVIDGAPTAVLTSLPDPPSLARLGARAVRVRDLLSASEVLT